MSFRLRSGTEAEHTAGDHVALDLGEPQFDLVEPRRVRWGEVQMNVAMRCQKRIDSLGLVRGEVVGDHMDFLCHAVD